MDRRSWIGIGLIVVALIAAALFLLPIFQDQREPPREPDFGSVVKIENVRIALPPVAGQPAAVFFDISNIGDSDVILTEVLVEDGSRANIYDVSGVNPMEAANIGVPAGRAVTLGPGTPWEVRTAYNENVVPGAELTVGFRFGNAALVQRTADVVYLEPANP